MGSGLPYRSGVSSHIPTLRSLYSDRSSLNHCHEGARLAVFGLVRERGPQFAIRHGHLVEAQLGAKILRKEHPVLGMLGRLPVLQPAQGVFVLRFELLGLQLVGPRTGGERDGLTLRLRLLKNRQPLAPVGGRGNRAECRVSDTRPVPPASHSVGGRSAACGSPAGGNR